MTQFWGVIGLKKKGQLGHIVSKHKITESDAVWHNTGKRSCFVK